MKNRVYYYVNTIEWTVSEGQYAIFLLWMPHAPMTYSSFYCHTGYACLSEDDCFVCCKHVTGNSHMSTSIMKQTYHRRIYLIRLPFSLLFVMIVVNTVLPTCTRACICSDCVRFDIDHACLPVIRWLSLFAIKLSRRQFTDVGYLCKTYHSGSVAFSRP